MEIAFKAIKQTALLRVTNTPSNKGKYTKPCPINCLLENKNKLVLQQPSIDLSTSIVFRVPWLRVLGLVVLNVSLTVLLATSILSVCLTDLTQEMTLYNSEIKNNEI